LILKTKKGGGSIKKLLAIVAGFLLLATVAAFAQMNGKGKGKPGWALDAKIIEACSCKLMCVCYFNNAPDKHFCQFNNAFRVTAGHYGNVKLDGLKFWVSGDLGDNFGDGTASWIALTFDPAATQEQMDAVPKILAEIYPLQAEVLGVVKKPISWEIKGDMAVATSAPSPIAALTSTSQSIISRGLARNTALRTPTASSSKSFPPATSGIKIIQPLIGRAGQLPALLFCFPLQIPNSLYNFPAVGIQTKTSGRFNREALWRV
jgi:hypothetical protein